MKRLSTIVLTFLFVLSMAVYVWARAERSKVEYYDRQTFKAKTVHQNEMNFGSDASITSTKLLYPKNEIKNSQLGIWSGGTRWGSGGLASVPDGWYIPSTSTYTGVTLVGVDAIAPVSSVTPAFIHSMYINTWDGTNASVQNGNTKFVLYPDSGVSTQSWWYKKFAGKSVTFGAWVNRDVAQVVASGVTTNFIRPVINSHSVHLSACSDYWKLGDFIEDGDWALATVTWDVPANADAFECGFAMNPTVLAARKSGNSGDSMYVVAPFLLINPLNKEYAPKPGEVITFNKQLEPWPSGGSTFGAQATGHAATSIDLSSANNFEGIIPDDTEAIYATVRVQASYGHAIQFYGDDPRGGVSFFGVDQGSGVTSQASTAWIPISSSGTLNVDNIAVFSGVSLMIHGAKMR